VEQLQASSDSGGGIAQPFHPGRAELNDNMFGYPCRSKLFTKAFFKLMEPAEVKLEERQWQPNGAESNVSQESDVEHMCTW